MILLTLQFAKQSRSSCINHGVSIQHRCARACLLAAAVILMTSGCGPSDTEIALKQKNEALRRQSLQESGVAPTDSSHHAPLSDSPQPSSAGTTAGTTDPLGLHKDDTQTAEELGLAIYPGAALVKQNGSTQASVQTGNGINIVLLEVVAPINDVIKFYDEKMTQEVSDPAHPSRVTRRHPAHSDRSEKGERKVVLSDTQPGNGFRTVEIHAEAGKTYIELMNVTGKDVPPGVSAAVGLPAPSRTIPGAQSSGNAGTNATHESPDPLHPDFRLPNP